MSEKKINLVDLIASRVHSEEYFEDLVTSILSISKADTKAKLMLELMTFCIPKIKAKDEDPNQGVESININFFEARPEDSKEE